jgi:DNA-binding beta-propeller fold protein YncE
MPRPTITLLALVLGAAITSAPRTQGQQTRRFLYAALPGVGGGNNISYGGAGILVFDIDHGHKFVKRVAMPTALPLPASTNGRPVAPQESIKGIAAHGPTGRVYISTNRRVAAFDLLTDRLVWEQRYEERGTDRIALSPDGTTLYAPELGAPKWVVADAKTGALITTIDKPGNPHNTQSYNSVKAPVIRPLSGRRGDFELSLTGAIVTSSDKALHCHRAAYAARGKLEATSGVSDGGEIDFAAGKPSVAGDQFGKGKKRN